MLLFKNGLRKLLKDYIQFSIYLVLIIVAVIFTSTFGIVCSNLIRTNNSINENYEKHDYSFRYTSSGYQANDTQTFTPWFAFNTKLTSTDDGRYFPVLTFGEKDNDDAVLLKYKFTPGGSKSYKSSIFELSSGKHFNFHFGDVESLTSPPKGLMPSLEESILNFSDEQKVEVVRSGEFGDFYKLNFNSRYFKYSLIGKLYEKNEYFLSDQLNQKQLKTALNIFDFMFYLNNSSLTSSIKNDLIEVYNASGPNGVEKFINEPINNETTGTIGRIRTKTKQNEREKETQEYYYSNNIFKLNDLDISEKNFYENYATFNIKKHDSRTLFKTGISKDGYVISKNALTQRNWFDNYFNLIADLSNFKIRTTNETVMWDEDGDKFRYISAFYNLQEPDSGEYSVNFYNKELYTIYSQHNAKDVFTENSFMVSNGYAKFNKMKLGQEYNLFPKLTKTYRLDALGVDSLNVYPTIYEEDVLTNQENEAIFYISNSLFSKIFNGQLDYSQYQDVSRAYLIYESKNKSNIENDREIFSSYFADNVFRLKEVADALNNQNFKNDLLTVRLENYDETTLVNLRSSLYPGVVKTFYLIAIIFSIIFILGLSFVVYNIFRKVLATQKTQIGNLKSLGVSNFKILINYVLYMGLPVVAIVPIGWGVSLFLQQPLMVVFERYFNIPTIFNVDWKILLVEWFAFIVIVSFMVFVTSYFTVKQGPLFLLSPNQKIKTNLLLTRIFSRIKYINFTSKLRGIIVSSSGKDLIVFFTIFFASSIVITASSAVPGTLKSTSVEFYKNIQYNNDFNYVNTIVNNPLTRYSFYPSLKNREETNLNASIFNVNIKTNESGNKFRNLIEKNDLNYWRKNYTEYEIMFETAIINNFLTFKGGVISPGIMNQLVEYSKQINKKTSNFVLNHFNNLTCQVMPTLFGQEPIASNKKEKQYNECIKSISNNILPSSVKQMWNSDEKEYENFSFNFGSIPFDFYEDQMYTRVEGNVANDVNTKVIGYGIDLENNYNKSNLILKEVAKVKHNSDLNYIPVLINKKMELEGFKVGDEFSLKVPTQKLAFIDNQKQLKILNQDNWKYVSSKNPKQSLDLYTMDLSKMSYYIKEEEKANSGFYYYDYETKDYQNYYNLQNVVLEISQNEFNQDLLNIVNSEYLAYSKRTEVKKIFPFDILQYENDKAIPLGFESIVSGTNNWMNIALEYGLLQNIIVEQEFDKKIKVVGVEALYDNNKFYLDQIYANEILGVSNSANQRKILSNGESINIWSNAKMSKNSLIVDQKQRLILNSINSNNASIGFDRYFNSAIGFTDYIDIKKEAINNLISASISISIIFILISMITSIIIIYLITDLFVGRYKNFMNYMRIQGYTMKEINSIMLWIFLPLATTAISIGMLAIWLLIKIFLPNVLINLNIAVPLSMSIIVFPIVFIIGILIFAIAYFVIIKSMQRVKLGTLIGNQ